MTLLGKITIHGQTPAQKNGKSVGVTKTGRTFVASNKRVKDWQKEAIIELEMQDVKFRGGRLRIDYKFYVKDYVQRDTDNMISSVNDILQVAGADKAPDKKGKLKPVKGTGVIVGDHWQVLKLGDSDVEIDKENPRVELTISEL